jgi:hypothetical protein
MRCRERCVIGGANEIDQHSNNRSMEHGVFTDPRRGAAALRLFVRRPARLNGASRTFSATR